MLELAPARVPGFSRLSAPPPPITEAFDSRDSTVSLPGRAGRFELWAGWGLDSGEDLGQLPFPLSPSLCPSAIPTLSQGSLHGFTLDGVVRSDLG